ncbi:zinc-binding dehydrogenase [Streptomyces sp. NPDC004596]
MSSARAVQARTMPCARSDRGDTGRATYALAQVTRMAEAGRFSIQVGQTFPLTEVSHAHRVGEAGSVRGKLVLLVADPGFHDAPSVSTPLPQPGDFASTGEPGTPS